MRHGHGQSVSTTARSAPENVLEQILAVSGQGEAADVSEAACSDLTKKILRVFNRVSLG